MSRPQHSFFNRGQRAPSKLEKKMDEKDRLSAAYRAAKRQQRAELDASAPPEWPTLIAAIKAMTPDVETGRAFIVWLAEQQWLIGAGKEHRSYALSLIDTRIDKILQYLGREPLDDPIEGDTVYIRAQRILRGQG